MSVGAFFFIINVWTYPHSRELWFFLPLLPWGVGLTIHYLTVFGIPGLDVGTDEWEERELQKEVKRLRSELYRRLHTDTESPAEGLELRDINKEPAAEKRQWDEDDLV